MDLFPAGDVALQEAHRVASLQSDRLSEKALQSASEAWRPHRGVAAHLLWAYYSTLRRGGIPPADSVI
jgi:DNA-3-methyladenine glycosylase II